MAKSKTRKTARKYQPTPPVRKVKALTETLKNYISKVDVSEIKRKSRLLSVVFCDFANRTNDGKVNLLGIFDRIYVHPDNKISPPFILYARTAETFEDNLWVRVFDPDDKPVAEIRFDPPTEVPFQEDRDKDWPNQMQFFLPVRMSLPKEGVYYFDIAYRDFSIGGAGVVVKFRRIPEDESGTDTYF